MRQKKAANNSQRSPHRSRMRNIFDLTCCRHFNSRLCLPLVRTRRAKHMCSLGEESASMRYLFRSRDVHCSILGFVGDSFTEARLLRASRQTFDPALAKFLQRIYEVAQGVLQEVEVNLVVHDIWTSLSTRAVVFPAGVARFHRSEDTDDAIVPPNRLPNSTEHQRLTFRLLHLEDRSTINSSYPRLRPLEQLRLTYEESVANRLGVKKAWCEKRFSRQEQGHTPPPHKTAIRSILE